MSSTSSIPSHAYTNSHVTRSERHCRSRIQDSHTNTCPEVTNSSDTPSSTKARSSTDPSTSIPYPTYTTRPDRSSRPSSPEEDFPN